MNPSSRSESKCPRCGESLPADAVDGLCPRCLMIAAMQPTQMDDPATPAPVLTPEELAPHFPTLEILSCLGRGGMGVVYKARQRSLNRLVALKLLAPERAEDPSFADRFEKEAQALAALNHPHIVGVHDFGQAGGFYYLLMEFVDGVNLRQLLQSKRLTPQEALSIVPPICEALQCAHEHGIVHRDIKPENLLMDKAGVVKIADFGIAKLVSERHPAKAEEGGPGDDSVSLPLGTPAYAAPEQTTGTADHRADIYSLGVVLYEMLTGERPQEKIEPPSRRVQVDVRMDEIVLRALEKTPELRYQSVAELRTELETVVQSSPGLTESAHKRSSFFEFLAHLLTGAAACPSSPPPKVVAPSRPWWHQRLTELLSAIVIVLILRAWVLLAFTVQTDALAPEIPRGSRVLVWQLTQTYAPGDILLYRVGERTQIGRVEHAQAGQIEVTRNGEARTRLSPDQITGRVFSVFWRARPDGSETLPNSPLGGSLSSPGAMPTLGVVLLIALIIWGPGLAMRLARSSSGQTILSLATGLTLFYALAFFGGLGLLLLSALRLGLLEALILLAIAAWLIRRRFTLPHLAPTQWQRLLAWLAFVLMLPSMVLAAFCLNGILSESGGWHPGPGEAFSVLLSFVGALLLPIASAVLWHQSAPLRSPDRSSSSGCLHLFLIVLGLAFLFLSIGLLVPLLSSQKAMTEHQRAQLESRRRVLEEIRLQEQSQTDFPDSDLIKSGSAPATESGTLRSTEPPRIPVE